MCAEVAQVISCGHFCTISDAMCAVCTGHHEKDGDSAYF